jgi:ABC-type bacteriocin/lantibiotic exporter with double-glycine peptidase domain
MAVGGAGGKLAQVRVPTTEQATNYTCGPAALRSALGAYGIGAEEDAIAAKADTSASGGTSVLGLADAAREFGVDADIVRGMTVDELRQHLDDGHVVLACIQSGDDEDSYEFSHWVVPCALTVLPDAGVMVECMDPAADGLHSVLRLDDFEARWHCLDMGERMNGLALVVVGDGPADFATIRTAVVAK